MPPPSSQMWATSFNVDVFFDRRAKTYSRATVGLGVSRTVPAGWSKANNDDFPPPFGPTNNEYDSRGRIVSFCLCSNMSNMVGGSPSFFLVLWPGCFTSKSGSSISGVA